MGSSAVCVNKPWIKNSALVFLTIALLLVYLSPYWSFEKSTRSASMTRLTLFLSSLFLLIYHYYNRNKLSLCRVKLAPLNVTLIALFIYLLGNSLFLSIDLQPVRRLAFIVLLCAPFVFLNLNERTIRSFIALLAVVIAGFAIYSLINHYLKGTLPMGYRKGLLYNSGTDGIGSFMNTIVAGMHYAVGFTVLTYLFFTEYKRLLLMLWSVLLTFVALYIALTFARSAWVACLVSALVMYILTFNKKQKRFYLTFVLAFSVVSYFFINFLGYEVGQRGLTHRDEIWRVVLTRVSEHWIFGHGLSVPFEPIPTKGGEVFVHNSHNVYLEVLYQVGIVGLLIFLSMLLTSIYTLFKAYRYKVYGQLSILFLSMLVAVSVVMLTELNSWVHTPNLLWMWLWVPVAIALAFEKKLSERSC